MSRSGSLAAIGGFVDIGDLVFNTAAGATFGYQLMWVIPIGVLGIIVYSEMCGRVAAVSGKAVFDAVRERTGFTAGLLTLVASELVNLLTLAAELGGVAIALQLLSGLPYRLLLVLAVVGLGACALDGPARVDGADLRLRRPLPACLRGRRRQARPGLDASRQGLLAAHRPEQPVALPLLRRRAARRGDDTVRGLLLFLGRSRGSLDAQGHRPQPGERDHRLLTRRLPLARADDRRRFGVPQARNRTGASRHDRARRRGTTGQDRPAAGRCRHPLCGRRRLDRHRVLGRLQPRTILRLGMGPLPPPGRRATLHAHLDRPARRGARRS